MPITIRNELIGSIPEVEKYRNTVQVQIAKWRSAAAIAKAMGEGSSLESMVDGYLIELCAMHFYGLETESFDTIEALINAMKEIDET